MTIISPTIGRVVLVHRFHPDLTPVSDQPEPALVTYVHSDRSINVGGFNACGTHFSLGSLTLVQEGDELPAKGDSYASWMPYQLQAAAKAEGIATGLPPPPDEEGLDNEVEEA